MAKIKFKNIRKAKHTFSITIDIKNDDSQLEYDFHLISLGNFEYGNSNNKETIYYPANVTIDFTIVGCGVKPVDPVTPENDYGDYLAAYYSFLEDLKYCETDVTIYKDDEFYFQGFIDHRDIHSNWKEKSFSVFVVSNFVKLKDIIPSDNPLGYDLHNGEELGRNVLHRDIIIDSFGLVFSQPCALHVTCDIRAKTTFKVLETPWIANFNYFGISIGSLFGHKRVKIKNMFDLLKSIFDAFGLICFFEGQNIYLQSRWYFPGLQVESIDKKDFISGLEIVGNTKKLKGLQLFVELNMVNDNAVETTIGTVEKDKDKNLKYPEEVEIARLAFAGGRPPHQPNNHFCIDPVMIFVPGHVAGLNNEQWTECSDFYLVSDKYVRGPLWKIIKAKLWSIVSKSRVVYKAKIRGTDWISTNYYNFETILSIGFRPRKYVLDFDNNNTVIEFVEGGQDATLAVPESDSVSEVPELLEIENLALYDGESSDSPVDYDDSSNQLENGEGVFVKSSIQKLEFDSLYNSQKSLAKTYKGTTLQLTDTKIWNRDLYYYIYMFESFGDQKPVNPFPTTNEQNGVWKKVMEIPDPRDKQKISVSLRIPNNKSVLFYVGVGFKQGENLPEVIQ